MNTYNDSARDASKTPDVKCRLGKLILLNFLDLGLISEDEFRMMRDRKYVEAPINIVISKAILQELATAHYKVTPQGFRRI